MFTITRAGKCEFHWLLNLYLSMRMFRFHKLLLIAAGAIAIAEQNNIIVENLKETKNSLVSSGHKFLKNHIKKVHKAVTVAFGK